MSSARAPLERAPVFRFAPSPNGYLHLGHARSALIGYEMAHGCGGSFLLRIEDIDTQRSRAAFASAIEEDLAWLGIAWSGPALRQSTRFPAYAEAASRLRALGLLYPCHARRSDVALLAARAGLGSDPDGAPRFDRAAGGGAFEGRAPARGAADGDPATDADREAGFGEASAAWDNAPAGSAPKPAWRLDMRAAIAMATARTGGAPLTFRAIAADGTLAVHLATPARWGDVVLLRKDTPASYHLAVVVDDAAQGVTHVTRGLDLLAATDVQRLLQVLLDLPEPLYFHHALITDDTGRKLAKRAGDLPLRELRAQGHRPDDVRTRALAGCLPLPPILPLTPPIAGA